MEAKVLTITKFKFILVQIQDFLDLFFTDYLFINSNRRKWILISMIMFGTMSIFIKKKSLHPIYRTKNRVENLYLVHVV